MSCKGVNTNMTSVEKENIKDTTNFQYIKPKRGKSGKTFPETKL